MLVHMVENTGVRLAYPRNQKRDYTSLFCKYLFRDEMFVIFDLVSCLVNNFTMLSFRVQREILIDITI